ncbi:MAG: hypothetical protein HOC74_25710 [Gemmatimonadetes bacterium]|jgi:hypothetical protein|nr:hypothetical protein [Gemmatimonadota bacterium]
MRRILFLFSLFALFLFGHDALAQTFTVKGVLRNPLGRTVEDGSYVLTLKLYAAAEGGTALWSETHTSVPVQHGVFGVELGSVESLATVSFLSTYWLGITVQGEEEMSPRIKLAPGPYSLSVLGAANRFPSKGSVGIGSISPQVQLALGDDDTGLQQQGADELGLMTAGSERVRINASGLELKSGDLKLKPTGADGILRLYDSSGNLRSNLYSSSTYMLRLSDDTGTEPLRDV